MLFGGISAGSMADWNCLSKTSLAQGEYDLVLSLLGDDRVALIQRERKVSQSIPDPDLLV